MGNKWIERSIKIPSEYDESERQAIADDVIEYLVKRTKEGKGEGGKKFSGSYSKSYKDSVDFSLKENQSGTIDLTLTGDMLTAIELLSDQSGRIKYGVDESSPEAGKAEGNIRGSYGKPRGNSKKARDFLSISQKELNYILKQYPLESGKARERATVLNILRGKVSALDFSGEE